MVTPGSSRVEKPSGSGRPVSESDFKRKPVRAPDNDPLSEEACFRWREYGKRDLPNVCDNRYDRS